MKKHLVRIALGLVVVLIFVGHAARYYQIPFVNRFENIVYDARLRLTMPDSVDPRLIIVDIDPSRWKAKAASSRCCSPTCADSPPFPKASTPSSSPSW